MNNASRIMGALALIGLAWSAVLGSSGIQGNPDTKPVLGEVQTIGQGPTTLLVIPCASCRWRSFQEFAERNRDRFTTVAVTLPGYGGTEPPVLPTFESERHWQPYALDALERLLDDKDLREVIVVGHSFGAQMALQIAVRRPDRIRGLVNLDGTLVDPLAREQQTREERLEAARGVREKYMEPLSDPDAWQKFNLPLIDRQDRRILYHGWFMATDRTAMAQYWWENLLQSRNPWLRALTIPILDVQLYSPGASNALEAHRRYEERVNALGLGVNYRLLSYHNTRHFLMEDRPDLLDALMITFAEGRNDYPEE